MKIKKFSLNRYSFDTIYILAPYFKLNSKYMKVTKNKKGGRTNQKRVRRGKRAKIFETIHMYVEKIFEKFNKVLRSFLFVRK